MIPVLLATFFSASFGLVVRYAQGRRCNLLAAGAINYATAAAFHLGRRALVAGFYPSQPTLILGLIGGCAFVGAYFLLVPFMRLRGVSIATAVLRLSVLMPILVSVLWWGERPGAVRSAGAALAFLSLPLLNFRVTGHGEHLGRRGALSLVVLFVANGICMTVLSGYQQAGVQGETSLFLGILFGTAAIIALIGWLLHRGGSSRRDLIPGIMLGLCNALGNLSLVTALRQLPSLLVFPFHSAVGLVYVAVFARVVWAERISRYEAVGMFITLVAVVLINLG